MVLWGIQNHLISTEMNITVPEDQLARITLELAMTNQVLLRTLLSQLQMTWEKVHGVSMDEKEYTDLIDHLLETNRLAVEEAVRSMVR
jgi:hypothetical protein